MYNHISCSPVKQTKKQRQKDKKQTLHRWSLLTKCISIALLRLCTWSFLLVNSLCTRWRAPHDWEKRVEMTGKKKKLGPYYNSKGKSTVLSVSKDRACLAARTWTATAQLFGSLREAGHHYLLWSLCVFMHGLLPSCPRSVVRVQLSSAGTTAECSLNVSCSQSLYSYRRRRKRRRSRGKTCAWSKFPPLNRRVPSGRSTTWW